MPLPDEDVALVRDSIFHIYEPAEPTQDITLLLDELNRDPTGIFFG
jgi:hypothetical protein